MKSAASATTAAAPKLRAWVVVAMAGALPAPVAMACSNDGVVGTCLCGAAPQVDASDLTLASRGITRSEPTPSASPGGFQIVHVFNFDFSINPANQPIVDATVNVGDTVRWLWDSGTHTVTSVSGSVESYDSGFISTAGATFDHTFTHPGVFWYFCSIHGFDNFDGTAEGMAGTVTVLAVNGSSWAVDADGSWNAPANWSGGNVPNAAGVAATFGSGINAPRTVSVNAPVTVGTITFDNANAYTIAGPATISVNAGTNAGAGINLLSGTAHAITAPLVLQTDATFNLVPAASTLTISSLQPAPSRAITKSGAGNLALNRVQAATLSVNAGTVTLAPSAGGPSSLGLLSVSPGATLDLTDNDLIIGSATSTSSIESLVRNARSNGSWNGTGLTSSAARNNAAKTTGLGVLRGDEYTNLGGTGTFLGQPYAATDTLVKYTWNGDANLSGTVSFDDYARIDIGFNQHLTGWANGDFNYDGVVNFDDYVLIDIAFNQQNGTLSRAIDWISGDGRSGSGRTDFGELGSTELAEVSRAATGVQMVIEDFERFGLPYAQNFLAAIPEPQSLLVIAGVQALACTFRRSRARPQAACNDRRSSGHA